MVLEKPLGKDRASAAEINDLVGSIFTERQIYRIDHYLGKEAVQNLIALRFGNTLFEPLWKRGRIGNVQITVSEQVGAEGRGDFYDDTGALRDMVQSHLLQLLCIIAMEPPASSDPDAVRDEKLKVLRALKPIAGRGCGEQDRTRAVQGGRHQRQARAGISRRARRSGGQPHGDFRRAEGGSRDVAMGRRAVLSAHRQAPPGADRGDRRSRSSRCPIPFSRRARCPPPNQLVIQLQPDESITLNILAKAPGEVMRLKPVNLGLHFADTFKEKSLDAYERLITDVAKGNLTLFMRRDELDAAWAWIDPIREGWSQSDEPPRPYIAGTWGPSASSALISRDGFTWHGEG